MHIAHSADGTRIAFDKTGQGPPVILVDGALCGRSFGPMPKLAAALADRFTVFNYDRRGRGDSGDTARYAMRREVEDIDALVREAGGSAYVFAASSGAPLALEAAQRSAGVEKLALYEAPWILDDSHPPLPDDFLPRLRKLVAEDRRADAVRMFMKWVGVPAPMIAMMRFIPVWGKLKAVAHTLPYDIAILEDHQKGVPLAAVEVAGVTTPTLVLVGGKSPAWMRHSMQALADALPNAQHRSLEGQTHNVKIGVVAPVLAEFFASEMYVAARDGRLSRLSA